MRSIFKQSKIEIKCNTGVYFSLILVAIPSSLILSVKNEGGGVMDMGLLTGQNPLSVAKVFC